MVRTDRLRREYEEAGALMAELNLFGFWDEHAFLTKAGDLGSVLRIGGVDAESLDRRGRDYVTKRLEAALRSLDSRARLYQYLFRHNQPLIPHASYPNSLVQAQVQERAAFLEAKADRLYTAEIVWVVMVDGGYAKAGLIHALRQLPKDARGSLRHACALFSGSRHRLMVWDAIEQNRQLLAQTVRSLSGQLNDLTRVEPSGAERAFRFNRRLVNFCPFKIEQSKLRGYRNLDWQMAGSEIEAHRGYLMVDDYHVHVLTMKELPGETRPLLLEAVQRISANFHLVSEWHPVDAARTRKEIEKRRRHYHNSKTSFLSNLQDRQNTGPRDELVDDAKQAAIAELGEALTALGHEGQGFGELAVTVVIYDRDRSKAEHAAAEFQKIFAAADGLLHEERYNLLNAFFATVPGNRQFNLRKQWATNANLADLSFLFTLDTGEQRNAHLGEEYLAVVETANATPYYLNLHAGDVAHSLVLGATGSGKSFLVSFLLQSLQKYEPLTFIFDLGASYESLTRAFSGSYLNVGLRAPGFSINPFALPPTNENLNFLFLFTRVLIESRGRYQLAPEEERGLYAAIERVYTLEPAMRTLSHFASILGPLGERLHRWTRAGQFGHLFDNAEDTLGFSRFQTFNFDGWNEYPDLLEPLLFYLLQRASAEIERRENASTFKVFVIDEAWMFLKNRTIREWITRAEKTWRKKNAAMILATQSVVELAGSDMLEIVNESCPSKIFLANPGIDRKLYAEVFQLNDTELELLESLIPKREFLLKQPRGTKKLRLEVDALSYWMATNNARDNQRKQEYFARYGPEEGLRHLAQDYPQPVSS